MPTFALKTIESIKARQEVDQLVVDGEGQLDAFEKHLGSHHNQYISELRTILTYVEYLANGHPLPATKFKDITPKGDSVKEYEFKSKHLRLYAIKKVNGKIIFCGGLKTNQEKDIKRLRSLKLSYLQSLKS